MPNTEEQETQHLRLGASEQAVTTVNHRLTILFPYNFSIVVKQNVFSTLDGRRDNQVRRRVKGDIGVSTPFANACTHELIVKRDS